VNGADIFCTMTRSHRGVDAKFSHTHSSCYSIAFTWFFVHDFAILWSTLSKFI